MTDSQVTIAHWGRARMPGCGDINCQRDAEKKAVRASEKSFCDPCISPIVAALNEAGIDTVASCCGHGFRPGSIALSDGRELVIARDFQEARYIDAIFPRNGGGNKYQSGGDALLDALKIMVAFVETGNWPGDDPVEIARAAIAQSQGKADG